MVFHNDYDHLGDGSNKITLQVVKRSFSLLSVIGMRDSVYGDYINRTP